MPSEPDEKAPASDHAQSGAGRPGRPSAVPPPLELPQQLNLRPAVQQVIHKGGIPARPAEKRVSLPIPRQKGIIAAAALQHIVVRLAQQTLQHRFLGRQAMKVFKTPEPPLTPTATCSAWPCFFPKLATPLDCGGMTPL